MRILICHGYQLRGTGGDRYVQDLARSLCSSGHQVLLMCQDGDPGLDFVSSFIRESGGVPELVWEKETPFPGNCMVMQPDIAGLLPAYAPGATPGFRVKEFKALDDEELDRYFELNRGSLDRLVRRFVPDVIHVNHALMLPFVARPVAEERGVPYFVSVHASALELAVVSRPRFLEYAARGLEGAAAVLAPGEHAARKLEELFGPVVEGLGEKLRTLAPGVDTGLFRPAEADFRGSVERMLEAVAERTEGVKVGDFRGRGDGSPSRPQPLGLSQEIDWINALHPEWLPDRGMGDRLLELADGGNPFVMYVGRLLETRGIQLVVPALPLILAEHPRARLVVTGFGELRGLLELMIRALDAGEMKTFMMLCEHGNSACSSRMTDPFSPVLEFLNTLASEGKLDSYAGLCRGADLADAVIFTGYLRPREHSLIMPHSRAVVVPTVADQAFGTVAVEAMAAGVTPLVSGHSGLRAAAGTVGETWGKGAAKLLLGAPGKMIYRIAASCRAVLDMDPGLLARKGAEMRAAAESRFSWEATAGRLLELYEEAAGRGRGQPEGAAE